MDTDYCMQHENRDIGYKIENLKACERSFSFLKKKKLNIGFKRP